MIIKKYSKIKSYKLRKFHDVSHNLRYNRNVVEVMFMKKKILTCFFAILLLCTATQNVQGKSDTLEADGKYHVVNVDKNGDIEILKTTDSYGDAKVAHTVMKANYNNLGITYGDSFLTIEQGVVSFVSAPDCSVNMEYRVDNSEQGGYLNGCYGNDGAFLEYNTANGKVKFKVSGVVGWANGEDVTIYPIEHVPSVSSFVVQKDILYHQIKSNVTSSTYANSLSLSKAPSYLKEDTTYYSYDTHYFYTSFKDMMSDYRNGTYKRAINSDNPYYNYYQYMSHRSTSTYSSKQLTNYFKDTLAINNTMKNFETNGNGIHRILTQSLLAQSSDAFIQYQNQFGSNALMMLSLSLNESAVGRSYIAYTKNNLFGHAAFDSSAEESASRYTSVGASVYSHALHYISNSYLNPEEFQFHGGFFGNKAGGMNVSYASDPYWGEKAAHYYYLIDSDMGTKDYNDYALGISERKGVHVYQKASTKSDVLYATSEGYDSSFILLEKVKNKEGTFYRVQSDTSLTKEKTKVEDGSYSYKTSYGYVNAKELTTIYNGDHIDNKSYVTITFNAKGGTFYPDTQSISMLVETGQLPVIIAPTKTNALFNGWDITLENAKENLTYNATYKAVKNIQLVEKPKTSYHIEEALDLRNGVIRVNFKDGKSKEVAITTDMIRDFTTATEGKQNVTIAYAGCTITYEIEVHNEQVQKQQELMDRAAYIIKTYSGKTGLTKESIDEITRFTKDIRSLNEGILSSDQIRVIDRILQENLKPRYSVIINDDTFDLQVSGLGLALYKETSFLNKVLPKTIEVNVDKDVASEDEELLKKVASANNMQIASMLSIDGTNDFSSLKTTQDMVFSIKKLKKDKNEQFYRVYYVDGNDVIQLPTTQSNTRIVFQSPNLGSYAIVYQNRDASEDGQDYKEVNTIQQNGKNYIKSYILLPSALLLILCIAFISFMVYRKKHKKKHKNKKIKPTSPIKESEERNHE